MLTSFRPLLIFWAIILSCAVVVAVWLQALGPLPQTIVSRPPMVDPVPPSKPASAPPSAPHPAPVLKLTTAAIPDPDPAMLETAPGWPDRMLPKVAGPGRTPSRLYAAAFDPAERHPRVALVIDGAGLDRALTEQVIHSLPSAIDLAYSAYAPAGTAAELAAAARRQGRECLVSIPMEPSGYPDIEEGRRALLVGGVPAQNQQDLDWALSNVAGCVGATGGSDGMSGARFAQSTQAFGDMLSAVQARGLLYLDARPGAEPPAGHPGVRVVDVIVDEAASPDEPADAQAVDRNLASLEQIAARRGAAIGLAGPPRPVLLDRIAVWAQGLAARGIVLAPLTAIPAPQSMAPQSGARQPVAPEAAR